MTNTNPFATTLGLTCQLCLGRVNALEGYIARHGHKRIKGQNGEKGYMTNGCAGSGGLPLEVSHNLLPPQVAAWKAKETALKADLKYFLDDTHRELCAADGYNFNGYEINNQDLDRTYPDGTSIDDEEDAEEILSDMKYHMGRLGLPDFEYGKYDWDQFWDHIIARTKRDMKVAKDQAKLYQDRIDAWEQTITMDQWRHNRHEIVNVKRTKATNEGWDNRTTRQRKVKPDQADADQMAREEAMTEAAAAAPVDVDADIKTLALLMAPPATPKRARKSSKPTAPRMHLIEYGEVVAMFSTLPDGVKVFESTPNADGSWDVIDTHPDWATVHKMYGDALKVA